MVYNYTKILSPFLRALPDGKHQREYLPILKPSTSKFDTIPSQSMFKSEKDYALIF